MNEFSTKALRSTLAAAEKAPDLYDVDAIRAELARRGEGEDEPALQTAILAAPAKAPKAKAPAARKPPSAPRRPDLSSAILRDAKRRAAAFERTREVAR